MFQFLTRNISTMNLFGKKINKMHITKKGNVSRETFLFLVMNYNIMFHMKHIDTRYGLKL